MRDTYHDELDDISDQLVEMIRLVAVAMDARHRRAARRRPGDRAEASSTPTTRVDALRVDLEDRAFQLLARQQPVATDLRMVVTTLQLSADLERMGDLALHVAKIARMRYPDSAVPAEAARRHLADGRGRAVADGARSPTSSTAATSTLAQEIEAEDDAMDALHRKLFTLVLSPNWAARHRGGDRHDAARPLLRAVRRPRRGRRPPRRSSSSPANAAGRQRAPSGCSEPGSDFGPGWPRPRWRRPRRRGRGTPPRLARLQSCRQLVDAAGCRSGCSAPAIASSRDAVEVLDQRPQRVAVRGDAAPSSPVRRSGTIASYQYGSIRADDVLEALGARHSSRSRSA